MAVEPIDYASRIGAGRSRFALITLVLMAIAAAGLAIAFLDGTNQTNLIGMASLPVAAAGTVLAIVAVCRRVSRGTLAWVSVGIAAAYWAAVAAMILPKLLASGRHG